MVVSPLPRLASERHLEVFWPRYETLRGHRRRLRGDAGTRSTGMLHHKVHQEVASTDFGSADSVRYEPVSETQVAMTLIYLIFLSRLHLDSIHLISPSNPKAGYCTKQHNSKAVDFPL